MALNPLQPILCMHPNRIALLQFFVSIILLACSLQASALETLRVLAWPGYADSDVVREFEQRFHVHVDVSFVSSDDVLREKIRANQGGDFDVFAANTAEIQYYIDQKLIVPILLSNIPNAAHQLPRFRNLQAIPGITSEGKIFAIPYTFSEMGLIYDRKQFSKAPTSMAAMWDPRYQGKVLAFNTSSHNFSIASMLLGGSPFKIKDGELGRVAEYLVKLRRNVLTFYSVPEEAAELFRKYSVALLFANYGRQQLKELRDEGEDVGYVIPREGALAWLDCWAVTRGAKNKRLAESWINYMLEPGVSGKLTQRQGLSNTITDNSSVNTTDKIIWLEPVENSQRRAQLWNQIISGDLPAKFRTP